MSVNFDEELKLKLLDMMKWFHNVCVDNNIRYYALGGTMLGAVRHQGFIPWDDDIDVGVPRADYEQLAAILSKKENSRYIIETPKSSAPDFFYAYSKIYDTETTLIEHTKTDVKRGIFIDVFPLDGLADTLENSKREYKKIDRVSKLLIARITAIRKERSFLKNAAVVAAQLVPSFLINNKKLQMKIDSMCKAYDYDHYQYGGNLLGHWRLKEVMPTSVMGTPKLYKFEDMYIYGAEDYETYLTNLYGDWRKLPPVEKQVSIHDFVECDLNKSFL